MSTSSERVEIYPATALTNVESLRLVLEKTVRNPLTLETITDEVEADLRTVEDSINGLNDRYFAIAQNSGGLVIGLMGLQQPEAPMLDFAETENPIELINAYVLDSARGLGIGRSLVNHLEDKALADGHRELLLNSGPRYMRSGWPFWRRLYGEPVGVLRDYYGPRYDAMVWRTELPRSK